MPLTFVAIAPITPKYSFACTETDETEIKCSLPKTELELSRELEHSIHASA